MDQMIWVEVLSRRREVAARLRFVGPEVRIGRAYDNDVVLDDPFVAASHVRVFRDSAGALVAEDAGSVNGIFLDRDKSRQARIVIDGERPIRIGHTLVRIRDRAHAVPPERIGRPATPMLPIAVVAVLALAVLGIEVLSAWLADTGEPKVSNYLVRLITIGGAIVAWVGGWVLVSRLLSGQGHLERNLLIALDGRAGLLALQRVRPVLRLCAQLVGRLRLRQSRRLVHSRRGASSCTGARPARRGCRSRARWW